MNLNTLRFSTAKAIRTLGIFGIMMALAGLLASGVRPASAASIVPGTSLGKVSVTVVMNPSSASVTRADIDIRNSQGVVVAKGSTSNGSSYVTTLAIGAYKVHVTAAGYKEYAEVIKIKQGETTTVKAALTALIVPSLAITTSSVPTPAPVVDPAPVPVQLGKLNVFAQFAPTGDVVPEAGILVADGSGAIVAKGTATSTTNFAAQLAPGVYKVHVIAQGYKEYVELVKVAANQTTFVKASLSPR